MSFLSPGFTMHRSLNLVLGDLGVTTTPTTWDPATTSSAAMVITDGITPKNTANFTSGSGSAGVVSTNRKDPGAGKFYAEVQTFGSNAVNAYVPFAGFASLTTWSSGNASPSQGDWAGLNLQGVASSTTNSGGTATGLTPNSGDVICLAVDFTSGKVWIGQNGVWANGNPGSGAGNQLTLQLTNTSYGVFFYSQNFTNTGAYLRTKAQNTFTVPTGFTAF